MVVLDVSVPTGFAAVEDSLARLLEKPKVKRYDVAGRKVIVYLEDMNPGEKVTFSFQALALYPVRGERRSVGRLLLLHPRMERGNGQPGHERPVKPAPASAT